MGITRYSPLLTTLLKMRGMTHNIGSCTSLVACADPPRGGWLLVENSYIQQAAFCVKLMEVNLKKALNDTILQISLWTMLILCRVCDYVVSSLNVEIEWWLSAKLPKKLVKHIFLQKIYHYNISDSYSNVLKGARVCYHNPCGSHLLEDDRMIRDLSYEWITFSISPDSLSTCICDEDEELM